MTEPGSIEPEIPGLYLGSVHAYEGLLTLTLQRVQVIGGHLNPRFSETIFSAATDFLNIFSHEIVVNK